MSLQFSLMSLHPIHQTSYSIWNRIDCQIGLLFLYAPDSQNFTVDLYDTLSAVQEAELRPATPLKTVHNRQIGFCCVVLHRDRSQERRTKCWSSVGLALFVLTNDTAKILRYLNFFFRSSGDAVARTVVALNSDSAWTIAAQCRRLNIPVEISSWVPPFKRAEKPFATDQGPIVSRTGNSNSVFCVTCRIRKSSPSSTYIVGWCGRSPDSSCFSPLLRSWPFAVG